MRLGKAQVTEDGLPVEFQDRTLQVVAIAQPRHVDDAMLKDADTGLRMFIGQPVADHLPTTEADVCLMDLQQGVQPLVHLRMDGVIRIDEPDIIAHHVVQTGIPRPTLSAILRTVDDLEAGIFFLKPVAQQATAVGGTVVDQDDLELLVGGPEDGRHTGLQVLRGIVNRNDDADQFPGHVTLDSSLSATSLPTM